ncbi:hypothetical protein K1T71_007192 [Dendrolimus kikuchii]|uniref:Uncharacterized protein n=1 Tax=Dendrolimus kikuchii TaxID=765133 RepID=A0ACC1CZW8_9NEOP|nr:hypothetical protein K1T71_007192 [Dendrolimus kikuchii]
MFRPIVLWYFHSTPTVRRECKRRTLPLFQDYHFYSRRLHSRILSLSFWIIISSHYDDTVNIILCCAGLFDYGEFARSENAPMGEC